MAQIGRTTELTTDALTQGVGNAVPTVELAWLRQLVTEVKDSGADSRVTFVTDASFGSGQMVIRVVDSQ